MIQMKYFPSSIVAFSLTFFPQAFASSETATIIGFVIDEDGKPIPGANVVVEWTSLSVISDFNGEFTISNVSIDEKNVLLTCHVKGYRALKQICPVSNTDTSRVFFVLKEGIDTEKSIGALKIPLKQRKQGIDPGSVFLVDPHCDPKMVIWVDHSVDPEMVIGIDPKTHNPQMGKILDPYLFELDSLLAQ